MQQTSKNGQNKSKTMLKYKRKLLIEFGVLFFVFAAVLVVFQWSREREFRKEVLESRLQGYADIIAQQDSAKPPLNLSRLRTTIIRTNGEVLYESDTTITPSEMGNHINRPEIKEALQNDAGYEIRQSATTGEEMFYFAKRYDNRIIRVAIPFDVSVQKFVQSSNNLFLWVFMLTFAVTFGFLFYMSDHFGRTVQNVKLKEREKTNMLKRQMTSNIAHELRTPVTAIHGYIETLLKQPNLSEERKQHFLRHALFQSERLTDLIRDVSLISKMEDGSKLLPREQLDLTAIVDEVCQQFSAQLEQNDIKLETSQFSSLPINGNYNLLHSIFRNLIENTIRYAGQHITISLKLVEATPTQYSFCYYDTGVGVTPRHLNRIFERFYRVEEGRTRNEKGGTGLGLSIVKNAVIFHGGTISAHTHVPHGLEFHFTLKVE